MSEHDYSWAAGINVLRGHIGAVWSVTFSSDDKLIVSGSPVNSICVWDDKTGEMVSGPFKGHTQSVLSVTFHVMAIGSCLAPQTNPFTFGMPSLVRWSVAPLQAMQKQSCLLPFHLTENGSHLAHETIPFIFGMRRLVRWSLAPLKSTPN